MPFLYTPHIMHDFHCRQCGYNLRELDKNGVCPECGHRIALSYLELVDSIRPGYPVFQFSLPGETLVYIAATCRYVLSEVTVVWCSWVMAREMRQAPMTTPSLQLIRKLGYAQLMMALVDYVYLQHGDAYLQFLAASGLDREDQLKQLLRKMIANQIIPHDGQLAEDLRVQRDPEPIAKNLPKSPF
jgi:hypothetical protein